MPTDSRFSVAVASVEDEATGGTTLDRSFTERVDESGSQLAATGVAIVRPDGPARAAFSRSAVGTLGYRNPNFRR